MFFRPVNKRKVCQLTFSPIRPRRGSELSVLTTRLLTQLAKVPSQLVGCSFRAVASIYHCSSGS